MVVFCFFLGIVNTYVQIGCPPRGSDERVDLFEFVISELWVALYEVF